MFQKDINSVPIPWLILRPGGRDDRSERCEIPAMYKQKEILRAHNIDSSLDNACTSKWISKSGHRGSEWVDRSELLSLDITHYEPFQGTSYILLPYAMVSVKKQMGSTITVFSNPWKACILTFDIS